MTNEEIASNLEEISEILEILQDNKFKARAYKKAAQSIRVYPEPVAKLAKNNHLREIPGVGKSISEKIYELVATGSIEYLTKLRKKVPSSLAELLKVPGIGPKTAKLVYDELGISDVSGLKKVVKLGKLKRVKGIGAKTETELSKVFDFFEYQKKRMLLPEAENIAQKIKIKIKEKIPGIEMYITGSLRRECETIGDINLVVVYGELEKLKKILKSLDIVKNIENVSKRELFLTLKGEVKSKVLIVEKSKLGAALVYTTGSKKHVEHLQSRARKRNLNFTALGLRNMKNGTYLHTETEPRFYKKLGLNYIAPFLREGRGEIEASLKEELPEVVKPEDIKVDFHIHSIWSDSSASLEEIAEIAGQLGYSYVVITDHAKRLKVARGITENDVLKRACMINKLNRKLKGKLTILSGIELNIDKNGEIDYKNDFLKNFDFCIASIHWGMKSSKERLTERIVRAMKNPNVHAIGHPSGRIIGKRQGYELDYSEIFKTAAETSTLIEINAFPDRLDLKDDLVKFARDEYGVKFIIGTDAHSLKHLTYLKYGLAVARRGWLTKKDVLNTYPLDMFLEFVANK